MRQKFFTKCVGFLFKKCDSFFHNILTILLPKAIVITKCVCTFRTFNPYSTTIKIFLEVYIFGRFKSLNEKNVFPSIWDLVLVTLTDASSRGQCVFWQTLRKISWLSGLNWHRFDEKKTQEGERMWNWEIWQKFYVLQETFFKKQHKKIVNISVKRLQRAWV